MYISLFNLSFCMWNEYQHWVLTFKHGHQLSDRAHVCSLVSLNVLGGLGSNFSVLFSMCQYLSPTLAAGAEYNRVKVSKDISLPELNNSLTQNYLSTHWSKSPLETHRSKARYTVHTTGYRRPSWMTRGRDIHLYFITSNAFVRDWRVSG